MQETTLNFNHSKMKLILQIIIFFPCMIAGYYITYEGGVEQSLLVILLGLFNAILFSCFWGAAILKLFRKCPYITLTATSILLDPKTRREVTIFYHHIESIEVSESSFQKLIEIAVDNEAGYFENLSLLNKIRLGPNGLFGFRTFSIAYNAIRKKERPQLLAALDEIMEYKEEGATESLTIPVMSRSSLHSQQSFMKKYDLEPLAKFVINKAYFKKAYAYSAFLFCLCLCYSIYF